SHCSMCFILLNCLTALCASSYWTVSLLYVLHLTGLSHCSMCFILLDCLTALCSIHVCVCVYPCVCVCVCACVCVCGKCSDPGGSRPRPVIFACLFSLSLQQVIGDRCISDWMGYKSSDQTAEWRALVFPAFGYRWSLDRDWIWILVGFGLSLF